jgi:hypothetical protein
VHAFKKFNAKGGFARLNALNSQASVYIQKLHDLSVRGYQKVGVHLNKPNVHRLVELYTHSIPMFGHARHVQELLFETAHQPLKRAISRSDMKDPHVSAVYATLCNDWKTRLSIEVEHLEDPNSWYGYEMSANAEISRLTGHTPPSTIRSSSFCVLQAGTR